MVRALDSVLVLCSEAHSVSVCTHPSDSDINALANLTEADIVIAGVYIPVHCNFTCLRS